MAHELLKAVKLSEEFSLNVAEQAKCMNGTITLR